MDGGLKKKWSAARPYNQRIVIELVNGKDFQFENVLHRVAHAVVGKSDVIEVETKLVTRMPIEAMRDQLIGRWQRATEEMLKN
ncbi:hypothetical protein SYK_10040 [Pseudodesulfovibrio nedwellii]|uniref:Uncharacterized protein n=1 Tax=Pseudodesulfovibrio nedwellii TaxID=2973072 RepID=A0ABM8AYQ3_9BACT|nr:hypothetical protein [Pseudodesulfovibrio nedwellii]BDQ36644.1 hypothetical protein SYK_10040 [Pseudodesulfovibrio nedwellii]